MNKLKNYLFSFLLLAIFILSMITDWYGYLSVGLLIILLIYILDKLNKGVVLREMIAFHAVFICLIMPLLGYSIYNQDNYLSVLWVRYMPVNADKFFGYALPAISAFVLAVCLPLRGKTYSDEGELLKANIARVKEILARKNVRNRGIQIIVVGIVMLFISGMLPPAFRFVALLFYFSAFAGVLYVYYSPSFPYKVPLLTLFALFIVANALRSGMFTVIAYMGITMFSLFFLGRKIPFWRKALFFVVGAFLLMLIQSIKPAYRSYTWRRNYEGSKSALFINLLAERISQGEFFARDAMFYIYYRANQGYNVALVMRRIPRVQPYDGGVQLLRAAASSVVPRVLWPDKPEAGGRFNMKYYAGITLSTWSTNIGPIGEAYASFGVNGGIVFMLCLGFFVRWAYQRVFALGRKIPLLICWVPVLFYQVTFAMETDTLQLMNSLVKSAFFIWLLSVLVPDLFGLTRSRSRKHTGARNRGLQASTTNSPGL